MESKKEKLNFFSRVKLAVAKLEDYNIFIDEKVSVAIKYFFLIVLILASLLSVIETYDFFIRMNKGYDYIKNELPNFNYSNGNLEFSENVNSYDSEFNFYLISDTANACSTELIREYTNKIKSQGLILFKDKAVFMNSGNDIILDYLQLQEQYGIDELDNDILLTKIDSVGVIGITIMYFFVILLGIFIVEAISVFMDWIVLSLFAFCVAKISRTDLNVKQTFNISIYSLTLPIILYMIYSIANYSFGFYTKYFKTMYLLIAYVYVVAVILIIKSDLMKQKMEVGKIVEIQKEVNKELNELEDDKKESQMPEKDKEDDKATEDEKDEGNTVEGEPDGSEI